MPSRVERRRAAAAPAPLLERRRRSQPRMVMDERWVDGWLAFKTRGEKRRLAPYPEDWSTVDDARLEELCNAAVVVQAPRRLIE
jgi:hypothetical protein